MTPKVKKLFTDAKNDKEFIQTLKDNGEEYNTPQWYWDVKTEILFATVYYGYLMGKGKFKKENYDI